MADNKNVNQEANAEKETAGKKPAAKTQAEKKEEKTVKEKGKKLGARIKGWFKDNKKALIAGGVGVATGVAGTIGVSEIGKRAAERKARQNRQAYIPEEQHSPLDPNY